MLYGTKEVEGRLLYCDIENRFVFAVEDKWLYDGWIYNGYHCGDVVKICYQGKWIDSSFEINSENEWYLTGTTLKGVAVNGTPAKVKIYPEHLKKIN